MGENKGHGIKGPRHDNDVDELGSNTASGTVAQGDRQQTGQQQQGNKQSGQQQGSRQSGQQGNRQHGGQHASGGTPALDDLGSRQGESAQDASQAWSQDQGDQQRGNR